MITITFDKVVQFDSPAFNESEMRELGMFGADTMRDRIGSAVDVHDGAARPLQKAYAKQKTRRNLAPLRNLRYSGHTLANLGVISAVGARIDIGFSDSIALRKASENAKESFGFSPNDEQIIADRLRERFPSAVARAARTEK